MSLGLGPDNPLPLTIGGGESIEEAELMALLDAYAPAWDASEGTANYAECQAYAQLIAMFWAVNQRLVNQTIPMRMLDVLTDWETILRLRPGPDDRDVDRRRLVASRLRALASNTIGDINDSCAALLGQNYDGIAFTDPLDQITYWPGINPGPPGFEWSTTRLRLAVRVNRDGLSDSDFESKSASLSEVLDAMLPAWMSFVIGVGDGFVCDEGICDETFL